MSNLTINKVGGFSSFGSKVLRYFKRMNLGVDREFDGRYLLAEAQVTSSLPIGAHLVSPRRFYLHHGIHLGGGEVAHYSGFSASLKAGPIEVTDLEGFANGNPVWVLQEQYVYPSDEIARRARTRVGENHYKVLTNNCEHFCSWCVSGKSYSAQVDAFLRCPRYLFSLVSALQPCFIA
ncbi:NC domain protein [compost metagenome]